MTRNFRSNIHICFPWAVSQRILLIMTSLICTILLDFESSILFKCLQYLVSAENCICHDISAFTPSNCCHLFPSSLHMAIAVDYITDINQKSTDSFRFTCRERMLEGDHELFIIWLCIDNTSVTMQRKSLDILSTSRFMAIWKIYRENFSTCTDRSKDHFSVLNFLPFVGNFIREI